LESEGFKIIASSLGGNLGRQIQFHTGTGEVTLRWLAKTRAEDVIAE
jgi:chemotaxis receptor (MCP) glutamine deamidase CheD